jgi:SMI1-KNR4 cell-wall
MRGEMQDLVTFLEEYQGKGWRKLSSTTDEEIIAAEQDLEIQFSEEYRHFLRYSNGGDLKVQIKNADYSISFYLWCLEELCLYSPGFCTPELPGAFFFATDHGDFICYFDTENRVGRGSWAVYGCDMGATCFELSTYMGKDLRHFFERVLNGENVCAGPYLEDEGFVSDPTWVRSDVEYEWSARVPEGGFDIDSVS